MLRKVFTLIFIFTASAFADVNLNKFRVSKSFFGDDFNRDNKLRYRGVGPELTPKQAIKAMLGNKSSNLKSMFTEQIRYLLMQKPAPFQHLTAPFISNLVNTRVKEAIEDNNNNPLDHSKASIVATQIAMEDFKSKYSDSDIIRYFVDYHSPYYYDFPNDPREVIFSTVYMEVAANYSSHVAVIDEQKEKSIDLNYYNFVKNNTWIRKVKPWPDKGEYVTPIEIPSEDITGYEIRNDFVKTFDVFNYPGNNLRVAFYKITFKGIDYVLIIKGNNQQGIYKDGKSFTYAVSNIDPNQNVPNYISSSGQSVEIHGIVKLCPLDKNCDVPKKLLKKYKPIGQEGLSKHYIKKISEISFNHKQAKIFFNENTLSKEQLHSFHTIKPEIKEEQLKSVEVPTNSQSFDEFTNKVIANDITNDPLMKYIDTIPASEILEGNNISIVKFKLSGEMSLNGGDTLYFSIPEKFHNLVVKSIDLKHRKSSNSDRTSLSLQLLSSHDSLWKVSGILDNKGRLRSPFVADQEKMKMRSIYGWDKNIYKTFKTSNTSSLDLAPQLMRIMSISRQTALLTEIQITFEGNSK